MRLRFVTVPLLVLLLGFVPAGAHDAPGDAHDPAPRYTQRDFRQLAARITGGASLWVDVSPSSSAAVKFHKEAHHFEESLDRNRDHVREDWRSLRRAFGPARKTANRGHDPRISFLVSHLEEDLAAGDRLVESYVASHDTPAPDHHGSRVLSFIDQETCVGTNRGPNSCNSPRDTLRFSIPRDVAEITRLNVEWRDLGGRGSGEIYLNDRLLWRTDVKRNWATDGKSLDVRVPLDSTLSVRSSNGDPIWIRRLSAETVREAARNRETGVLENLFGLLWPERGRDAGSD